MEKAQPAREWAGDLASDGRAKGEDQGDSDRVQANLAVIDRESVKDRSEQKEQPLAD
jgi:hypothetical protein